MTNLSRMLLIPLLALLALPGSASALSAGQARAECHPQGTETLAASPQIRIYKGTAPRSPLGRATLVYGCLKSSGKTRRLGPIQLNGGSASMPGPFALKATWASAVEDRQVGQDTTRVYATSRNIQTDKGRRCLIGSADRPSQLPAVRVLLIDKAGALAWAAITPSPTGRAPLIGVCDSQGARILDSGAGVEINTMQLHGSTLSWSNAGGPRSAQLH
jgi:hypothetical protein